ncbi:MAG TPA: YIP1 family protein [Terriglobia bacterium]|nr:YIP1 family protein [Terriglobia bacterium]
MESRANPVSPSLEGSPGGSFAQRFAGIFFSPTEAFRTILRAPDILPPLIVLVAVSVAAWEAVLRKIGIAQLVRASLEQSGRAKTMTPEQIQQAVSQSARFLPIVYRVVALVGVPIFLLIIALIGLAILKAIFGQQLTFKVAYSITTYAELPAVIAGLLGILVVLFGDPTTFNPTNPAPTNLGFFLSPEGMSKPLYTAASSVNPFSLWFMALLGIGFSEAVGRKVRARTIFLCFFSLWVLWVLLRMGLAAI